MDEASHQGAGARGLRVMTYNLRAGLGASGAWDLGARDDAASLGPILEIIRRCQPDVVALQEVIMLDRQGGCLDQARWLGERLGMEVRFGPVVPLAQGGFWGNAFLSRLPVLGAHTYPIQHHPEDDPRSLLKVRIDVGGQTLTCYSAHLSYRPAETARQVVQIAPILREALVYGPVVLAGDFNASASAECLEGLPLFGRDAFTLLDYAMDHPARQSFPHGAQATMDLDHVFLSEDIQPLDCRVVIDETGASDHNPLLADCLVLPSQADPEPDQRLQAAR